MLDNFAKSIPVKFSRYMKDTHSAICDENIHAILTDLPDIYKSKLHGIFYELV